jgi:hypothetical protein
MELAGTSGRFDLVGSTDEVSGAGLHTKAIERRLAQCMLDAFAEVGGDEDVIGLERPLQGGL